MLLLSPPCLRKHFLKEEALAPQVGLEPGTRGSGSRAEGLGPGAWGPELRAWGPRSRAWGLECLLSVSVTLKQEVV